MMRRIIGFHLMLIMMFGMTAPCYAAGTSVDEEHETINVDVYARYVNALENDSIPVMNGSAEATTDNGYTISVADAPSKVSALRVVPIPSEEKTAWGWFSDCIDSDVTLLSIFDIYFEDAEGNRMNINRVGITIASVNDAAAVFSVAITGTATELSFFISDGSISFTANGSHYYVLAQEIETDPTSGDAVTIEDPKGGDVKISDENPEAGESVTITPIPDVGKEVDKIVVEDENGDEIPVIENGDGTYSYVQPDGDVIITVKFRDESGSTATGDNSRLDLFIVSMIILVIAFVWKYKNKTIQ